jgi:HAD superfamily hydrolase (TIGR01549 family)
MTHKISAIFWDFDGTVADTQMVIWHTTNAVIRYVRNHPDEFHGMKLAPEYDSKGISTVGNDEQQYGLTHESFKLVHGHADLFTMFSRIYYGVDGNKAELEQDPQIKKMVAKHQELSVESFAKKEIIYPGVLELIEECKSRGILNFVTTNNKASNVFATLSEENFGVGKLFAGIRDYYVGGSEGKTKKPHTNMFDEIIKEFRLDPHKCIIVGDSSGDWEAARKLGIKCVVAAWNKETVRAWETFMKQKRENGENFDGTRFEAAKTAAEMRAMINREFSQKIIGEIKLN